MNRSLRIAIADDEPDMRDYYKAILPRLDHQVVVVAETGADLVAQCLTARPDLVITDVRMPDMDGIEAAIALHATRAVPVILVSGYHDADLVRRAGADNILAYLVKPIKLTDLVPAIAIAIRQFEKFEQLRQQANA